MADDGARPWEYRTLRVPPGEWAAVLARAGRAGWELVQARHAADLEMVFDATGRGSSCRTDVVELIFKRPMAGPCAPDWPGPAGESWRDRPALL